MSKTVFWIKVKVEADERFRRALSHRYGLPQPATRTDLEHHVRMYGESIDADVLDEWESYCEDCGLDPDTGKPEHECCEECGRNGIWGKTLDRTVTQLGERVLCLGCARREAPEMFSESSPS